MNQVLLKLHLFHGVWIVTPWKLIGYTGIFIFAGRWLVQVVASHRAGRSHLPRLFWYMSLVGSALLLGYFALSDKRDSVGILSNLFPASIAAYNLILELRRGRPRDEMKEESANEVSETIVPEADFGAWKPKHHAGK